MKVFAGLGIAVLLVVTFVAFQTVEVCEDQLPATGGAAEVVEVCRHLSVSDAPTVALGVALLALVGVFYNEVSGFGITLKRAVRDAKESADRAGERSAETARSVIRVEERLATQISQINEVNQKLDARLASTSEATGGSATAIGAVIVPGGEGLPLVVDQRARPKQAEQEVPRTDSHARARLGPLAVQPAYTDARIGAALRLTESQKARAIRVAVMGGVPDKELWGVEEIEEHLGAPYVAAGAASQAAVPVASAAVGHILTMAPDATIFPIGVVAEDGRVPSTATLQDGVMAALALEPDVILLGVGGGRGDPAIDQLLSRASTIAFVVAGAGNAGGERSAWPGSLPHVASVAALDSSGRIAAFSNRGVGVDLAVRGAEVLSLTGVGEHGELETGTLSGTSISEQLVGGVGALLISRAGAEPPEILQLLRNTAAPSEMAGGIGKVDAEAAVRALLDRG